MTIIQAFIHGEGNPLGSARFVAASLFSFSGGQQTGSQVTWAPRGTIQLTGQSFASSDFASSPAVTYEPTDRTRADFSISSVAAAIFITFSLRNNNYSQLLVSTTNPSVSFNSDGSVTKNGTSDENWGSPSTTGAGSGYWIKFHQESGDTLTDGPYDSWVQLNASRMATLVGSAGAMKQALVSYLISNAAAGATLASGNIQLESNQV